VEFDPCLVDFIADRYSDLLELKLAIADHPLKDLSVELNGSVRDGLPLFADEKTCFSSDTDLFEDELAQGGNPCILIR
jgi:hypothetical protein